MMSHIPDPNDAASIAEQKFNANGVKAVQDLLKPQKHPDFDGEHCLDCGVEIPAARLADGRIRCVDCQSLLEVKSKQYR
jgi:RNA polymerase-binding transcription factor DksA